jgi:quinol monooxygenase YgiN
VTAGASRINVIIESVRITVHTGQRDELRKVLITWVRPIELQPGCRTCRILQEASNPNAFCYQAMWETQDDLLRHLRSSHYKRLLVLMDLGDGPPVVEFHNVAQTQGLDLIERARSTSIT